MFAAPTKEKCVAAKLLPGSVLPAEVRLLCVSSMQTISPCHQSPQKAAKHAITGHYFVKLFILNSTFYGADKRHGGLNAQAA